MRAEIDGKRRDSALRVELDRIRLEQSAVKDGRYDHAAAAARYRTALGLYGIDPHNPATAGAVLHSSRLRSELMAAIDDWVRVTTDAEEKKQLLALLDAESDQDDLRAQWRAAKKQGNGKALAKLWQRAATELPATDLVNFAYDLTQLAEGKAAEEVLREGARGFPDDFWVNHNLGRLLVTRVPPQAEEGVRFLTAAAALRSRNPGVLVNLGSALHDKGEWNEAIRWYNKALEIDPKSAQAHAHLGFILDNQHKVPQAVTEYRLAIACGSRSAVVHTNLGAALIAQGNLDEAVTECSTAIALDSQLAGAYHNLGIALMQQGKLPEAVEAYRKAIPLDPKDARPHCNLGIALMQQGKLPEAVEEYHKAIDLDPKFARPHDNLGIALAAQGKLPEAVEEYHKAIDLDHKDAQPHNNLGTTLATQDKLTEAVEEYNKAIALDPNLAHPHIGLGNVLQVQGKLPEAVEEYHKAIDLDRKLASPHQSLGIALAAQGKLPEAVEEYHKAIDLDHKFALAHWGLGEVLLQLGDFVEARQAIRRCLQLLPPRHPFRDAPQQLLHRCEAALRLNEKLPALLRGDAQPTDAAEALALAQLCQQPKQLHVAAARFYADAFHAEPKLVADLDAQHRYSAACCAALAAAGKGKDTDSLGEPEHATLRRQALDWLRADLKAYSGLLEKNKAVAPKVRQRLAHWLDDTALASVRDAAALAKLQEAERNAWRKLWADVEALSKRSQEK